MGKVLVDYVDIEAYRFGKMIARPGKEGTCYYSDEDGQVIKLYHILNGRKVYFDDLENKNIAFPNDILVHKDSKQIAGYTMNYLSGSQLYNGFSNEISISKLKDAYLKLKKLVLEYKDIYMDDMCLQNILFNSNNIEFNLIDTSRWYPCFNSFDKNMNLINDVLIYSLCRFNLDWLNEYNNKSKELFELYRLYKLGDPVPFIEFLECLMRDLEEKFGIKANIIEDLTPKVYKK